LHLHTTFSDGTYTPAELIDLARCSGLAAVAVTDHDTLNAVPVAHAAAAGTGVEVIPGAEITSEHRDRELHLLAYFVALDNGPLNAALEAVRAHRVERFREMVERLRQAGVSVSDTDRLLSASPAVLGRRHLAEMLVRAGRAATVREAFTRYLHDRSRFVAPKQRVPVENAIRLVRGAGGVAAWAHPPYDCTQEDLRELRRLGLGAVEVEFPEVRNNRGRQLRTWATELGLAITGGSDCHGPGRRTVGACTVSAEELDRLRQMV
jgi:predicted metal-dependent phosphoesterase TrpH